jgi:hypothetical protein
LERYILNSPLSPLQYVDDFTSELAELITQLRHERSGWSVKSKLPSLNPQANPSLVKLGQKVATILHGSHPTYSDGAGLKF